MAESRHEHQTWARNFDRFEQLEHAVTDAGSGLLKGLAFSNQRRQQDDRDPIEHSLDVFHSKYEGNRTWRVTETRLWKAQKKAGDLWRPLEKQRQQGKSIQGKTQKAHSASCHADTWAKTVRMLERPQSLTFLDRIAKQLAT